MKRVREKGGGIQDAGTKGRGSIEGMEGGDIVEGLDLKWRRSLR